MKILFVCSHGGHLTELINYNKSYSGNEIVFVTYDNPRTRNLPFRKYLFPNFGKNLALLIRNLPKFIKIIINENPDIIISNGAEIAIPFFVLGKLLRIKSMFIETYTRIDDPTLTGKFVYHFSSNFIIPWKEMEKYYGRKACFIGSPYLVETYKPIKNASNIITVFVGTHSDGFSRLVVAIDEISSRLTNYEFIMQIGKTEFKPKSIKYFEFIESDQEIIKIMLKSRFIICQGAMTAVDALLLHKNVIVVPRLKKYGEHINDHQLTFSKTLESLGLVKVVDDIKKLESIILNSDEIYLGLKINDEFIDNLKKKIADLTKE